MNAQTTPGKNANSHNTLTPEAPPSERGRSPDRSTSVNSETLAPPEASSPDARPTNPLIQPPTNPSLSLLPQSALDRKFRATSFAAKLTDQQRATLTLWLIDEKL